MHENSKQLGRYTLNRMIARGGMGEIYLAHLQGVAGFEKTCVIKKIRHELAQDETFVERFFNEGRTLVALSHSNIVQTFDMDQVDGEVYLAMEYVDGADLRTLLRNIKSRQLPVKIAISVTQSVLCGLAYAHRATDSSGQIIGIVHRDISPSNILISTEGDVKIIDFGIAKGLTSDSCSGIVQGKFAYMSPEQARGDKLDARSDLFSVGLVLYEMLSGVRPFEGTSDLQTLERVKNTQPQHLEKLRDDVDENLNQIVMRALEKDQNDRFSDADEFNDALSAYLKSIGETVDQRDVAAFFRPLMHAEPIPQNIDDALNAMLDAQVLGLQETETKTLVPRSSSQNARISRNSAPVAFEDTIDAVKRNNSATFTPSSELNISQNVSITTPTADSPQTPSAELALAENLSLKRRIMHRVFYIALGAILACVIAALAIIHWWSIDSQTRAQEVRETLLELRNGKSPSKTPEIESFANQNLSEMPFMFRKGLPFKIITSPDYATIYIIEGVYRELQNKTVILIPDSDVEIAIQAPGYETCMFYVQFSPEKTEQAHNLSWKNCGTVASKLSVSNHQIEINVSLTPLQGQKLADEKQPANIADSVLQPVPEPELPPENDVKAEDTPIDVPAPIPVKREKKAETAQINPGVAPSDKTQEKPATKQSDKPQKTTELKKTSVKSSVQADFVINGKHYTLPAEIEAEPGRPFQIQPTVHGRKIGFPFKGVYSGSPIDVHFCEASVRIKESFAPNDPAPYQLSDIYLDGTRIATKADSVSLVLPCKSYVLEAKIQAGNVMLSEKQTIELKSSGSNVFSLKLKPE